MELNCHSNIAPRRQALKPSIYTSDVGAWAPAYVSTEQHLHGVNQNREGASGRGPTGGEQRHWRLKKKTTETEARSSLATVCACMVPRWSIPGKIWKSTNQIRAVSARAHVSHELRARALQASRGIQRESISVQSHLG